jgi:hypothetical protein
MSKLNRHSSHQAIKADSEESRPASAVVMKRHASYERFVNALKAAAVTGGNIPPTKTPAD